MMGSTPGARIHYEVEGDGPGVVLLHAFPLHLGMWDEQVSALSRTHRVLRFDARGFGRTPPGDALLTMERIADDAVAVMDHTGVGGAVVAGVSMGGYAALAFARRHPARLTGLVLSDTRAAADTPESRRSRAQQADAVRREGTEPLITSMLPRMLGATTQAERKPLLERVRGMMRAADPRGVTDALAGLAARADSTPSLREIRVPTLVLCGAEDTLTPPKDAEALQRGIAGSTLTIVPAAGHLANLENPEPWNQALLTFLKTVKA